MVKPISELADCNPDYQCVMNNPTPEKVLNAETWSLHGRHITIPSRRLFVTDDGSVYVVIKRKGNKSEYASMDSLIKAVKNTVIIESFSCLPQT